MGIERLEPLILRKEVDRRLWVLRSEQIRNTGMRFKLQTTSSATTRFSSTGSALCAKSKTALTSAISAAPRPLRRRRR